MRGKRADMRSPFLDILVTLLALSAFAKYVRHEALVVYMCAGSGGREHLS